MDFGTYPTGWYIEGDLPNQVAVAQVPLYPGLQIHNQCFNSVVAHYSNILLPAVHGVVWTVAFPMAFLPLHVDPWTNMNPLILSSLYTSSYSPGPTTIIVKTVMNS